MPWASLLKNRIVLGSILLVCISAIIIERAINGLILEDMSLLGVLGFGIVLFGLAFVFGWKQPKFELWLVIAFGCILMFIGEGWFA